MAFKLITVNVFRDFVQGLYGNRIPLDDEDALAFLKLWDELVEESLNDETATIIYDDYEVGGAHPQVTAEFTNRDFMEVYRILRKYAPHTALRPLDRSANVFMLSPMSKEDIEHIIKQLAQDTANPQYAAKIGAKIKKYLNMKVFDSQGIIKEAQSTFDIIGKLRRGEYEDEVGNKVKYLINAESAIPYGNGPFYPNAIYLQKVEDSYNALLAAGLPINESRISLKDMIGQLDVKAVTELLPEIIKKLKDLQKDTGTEIPIGLHLHDTGCAKAAYAEAIKICKQQDYPIAIDTVECDPYKEEYVGENAYRNTGFVGLRDLDEACKKIGIDLGIKLSHRKKLDKMGKIALTIAKKYSVRRVESLFSGQELRDFDIPGGAFASFSDAVKSAGIAKKLKLDERDALLLVGNGLKAVAKLMGYPFAVTPGYQNKQIAALNLINNLINNSIEDGKKLKPEMSINDMIKLLLADLSADEVDKLFLTNLDPVVKEFLKGEMPADTLSRMGITTTAQVHPVIRNNLGRREKLLTDIDPKVNDARKIVEKLYQQGLIKPTQTQIEQVQHEFQGQSQEIIERILKERAIQTHITWALELGNPSRLEAALKKPWLREPNPKEYQGDKTGYQRALAKTKKSQNPQPDDFEMKFLQMQQGKLSLNMLYDYKQLMQESERLAIWSSIILFIKLNLKDIEKALASKGTHAMDPIFEKLYQYQDEIINEKENKGEYFTMSKSRRRDMALDFMAQQLMILKPNDSKVDFHKQSQHKREDIEVFTLVSPMAGQVVRVNVKPNDVVKKGDSLLVLNSMKSEYAFTSAIDGIIEEIAIKEKDIVTPNQLLIRYKKNFIESMVHNNESIHKINETHLNENLEQQQKRNAELQQQLKQMKKDLENQVAAYQPLPEDEDKEMAALKKRGYFGPRLSLTDEAKKGHEKEIHVIGNRDTSGIKLLTDLTQAKCQVRLMHTAGDRETNLIKYAKDDEKILIRAYDDIEDIIKKLHKLALDNPAKTIYYHPGWGFLSESPEFVKAIETCLPKNVVFVGPPSDPMEQVGGKKTCRDLVASVAPEFNPRYFGPKLYAAADIKAYIDSGYSSTHVLHSEMNNIHQQVIKMGGDVMIKAVAGGGGFGILQFDAKEQNYHDFVNLFHQNINYSEGQYKNGQMLIEEFIGGNKRHVEVQIAVNDMGAMVFGIRDCTAQHIKAKTNEMNLIQGDYPTDVTSDTLLAINKLGKKMQDIGYRGLCTVEMLIAEDGSIVKSEVTQSPTMQDADGKTVKKQFIQSEKIDVQNEPIKKRFLEGNPRLQVEHPVTEEDIRLKTGKNISLPLINLACLREKNISLADILKRDFGFTDADLMKIVTIGTERIEHVRLNSFVIDVLTGNHGPSYFWGYMWAGPDIINKIAKETGAHIIIGDIGAAESNRQTGAVWGTSEQVHKALAQINKLVEVARACLREDGTLSIDSVLAFHELAFDAKGNFSKDFTTLTQDEFLEAVKKKEIIVEMDKQHLGAIPALKPGAMKKAFEEFLAMKCKPANQPMQQQQQTVLTFAK